MNTTDTFSPFWARVCTIIKQAVGIWPVGAQRGCTQPRHPSNRDLRRKHLLTAKLYFPQKNGHEKRLDLLSQFGLFDK